jgi:hypothetical protein
MWLDVWAEIVPPVIIAIVSGIAVLSWRLGRLETAVRELQEESQRDRPPSFP